MKSHDLANELLSKPNVELIKQTDDEGNGYTEVNGADFGVLVDNTVDGYEVYSSEETAEDLMIDDEEYEDLKGKYAVIY